MADEERTSNEQPESEAAPPKEKKRGGLVVTLLIVAGCLVAGGATGLVLIGPRMASASDAPADSGGGHGGGSSKGGGHGGEALESPAYSIENIVVNPAGTQGTRFLVMSIAVELADGGVAASLRERDPQVRDVLLNLLASRTVDQLADLSQRDSLRADIRSAIERVAGKGTVARVFLPQFVLQ